MSNLIFVNFGDIPKEHIIIEYRCLLKTAGAMDQNRRLLVIAYRVSGDVCPLQLLGSVTDCVRVPPWLRYLGRVSPGETLH